MTIIDKIVEFLNGVSRAGQEAAPAKNSIINAPEEKSGTSLGEFDFEGVEDDETVAAILAAVSDYTDIPMNELKITSIRAIE